MIAGNPWTLFITLESVPQGDGCTVRFQEMTMDGTTSDQWDRRFKSLDEALKEIEMSYGVGPDQWVNLDD